MEKIAQVINNVVVTIAAIVGGLWVLNRLKRERTDEAALEMNLTANSSKLDAPPPDKYLVVFTVELANRGKTKIEAKTKRTVQGNIFEDGPEMLKHSCSLQIRRIDEAQVGTDQSLDWFEGAAWQLLPVFHGDAQIDVLIDYRNANEHDSFGNEIVEFWMEPGETYRPGVPVVLPKGAYVAKLTFVAADQERDWLDRLIDRINGTEPRPADADQNFWSQIYGFNVPTSPPSAQSAL